MKLEYTLTLTDFQAAQDLHWRQTLTRRAVSFSVHYGLPALTAGVLSALLMNMNLLIRWKPTTWDFLFGVVVAFIYLITTLRWRDVNRYRKHYERNHPPDKRNAWIEFNDTGITSAIVGTEPDSYAWSKLCGFVQDEKITMFYVAKNRFVLCPTYAMTSAQRTELAELVSRNLSERKSC